MRVFALRRRVIPGDRLVLRFSDHGPEHLTDPVREVGEHNVVLMDGTLVPFPPGKGVEVERD